MTDAASRPCLPACFRRFPGAVVLVTASGVVADANGVLERELGRPLRGRPFADVLDPGSSRQKWERALARVHAGADEGGGVWELVLLGRDSLPEPRPFSLLRDDDTGAVWVVEHRPDPRLDGLREQVTEVNSALTGTQRDLVKERGRLAAALEELRARGEELERSNRALDEFAHVVSHDLKAPLRGISRYAEWLEEDLAGVAGEESRAHLARLRDRVARLAAMVDGALAYARAGRERARPEPVDVGALVAGVVDLLDPPASVRVAVDPGMPALVTERAPLQQVFLNLVGNALTHAARGGAGARVRVRARPTGEAYEFSVEDDGPGIPAAVRDRIWTLFHTAEPEERARGTGIGLAVVKQLVESRGGRAWVESEEGAGAAFRFTWPAGDEGAAAASGRGSTRSA